MMKNQKGITLIALVITIIVLLILAGVSIAMLTGDNGILTQANKATVTNIEARVDEEVKLAVQACKLTIENELANDNSWNATTQGILPEDDALALTETSSLSDTNGVLIGTLASDLNATGYKISATAPTGADTAATRTITIEYTGSDYTKATNKSSAKIAYTLNVTQHEVKINGSAAITK